MQENGKWFSSFLLCRHHCICTCSEREQRHNLLFLTAFYNNLPIGAFVFTAWKLISTLCSCAFRGTQAPFNGAECERVEESAHLKSPQRSNSSNPLGATCGAACLFCPGGA